MIVIMQQGASQEQVEHVADRIRALGLSVHLSQGEFRTIIGAIGDKRPEHQSILEAIEGVDFSVMYFVNPDHVQARIAKAAPGSGGPYPPCPSKWTMW